MIDKRVLPEIDELSTSDKIILLNSILSDANMTASEVGCRITMSKRQKLNSVHHSKICVRPDGRYYTYVEDCGKRKQLIAPTEYGLIEDLYSFYYGEAGTSLEDLYPDFMMYRRDRNKVTPKTIEENRCDWRKFLSGTELVKKPIKKLTTKDFLDYFELLTLDGKYTAKRIGNLRSLLNKMYDYAIRHELVDTNPIKNIDFKEFNFYVPFNEDHVYKKSERSKLLNYLKDKKEPYALAIRLMFQLTVRIGELKSFSWDDIDLEERTIRIHKQVLQNRRLRDDMTFEPQVVEVVDHTKKNTPQGKRILRLTKEAVNILMEAKEINPYGEFVFMPQGHLMRTSYFDERLEHYCKEAGVPYYSSHKIRFTSASNLYNGKNLMQVSRALGHSQVATTLHYFRNIQDDSDEILEQMEEAFAVDTPCET